MKKAMPYIRSIIFIVLMFVIFAACDYVFSTSGYIRCILHRVNDSGGNYDTVILGASHARSAIDPHYLDDELGVNAINVAIPGETVWDSYYLIQDIDRKNDIKTLILDVDYQYWNKEQPENHFTKPFIYQQMAFSPVKLKYLWDNQSTIDIRNVFTKRLSYNCEVSAVQKNLKRKFSKAYQAFSLETATVDGADGPYKGKGFFYRKVSGQQPGGEGYLQSWIGLEKCGLDQDVIDVFTKMKQYCDDNGIRLICVSSPVTPSAVKRLGMHTVHRNLAEVFNQMGVEYYDFNLTRNSVLPRTDLDYGDLEGHMGGELAEQYSSILSDVVADSMDGAVDRSKYFYQTFNEMYEDMGYGAVDTTDQDAYQCAVMNTYIKEGEN